ncbi:hypothetical protein ALP52_05278 [Pseudomonas amygdali pv. mori]|uniref:Uncharacterized protein n=1 Tax=Pseudomonas amygdali pv. mori TaxID=34065 RepID=A0A3M5J6J7_PSEA0|nr:hypothetical protein ALP52_05278 [Pseudomonas amygdali pv. mori]
MKKCRLQPLDVMATALQTRFTHHRMCSVDYYHHLY